MVALNVAHDAMLLIIKTSIDDELMVVSYP